MDIKNLTVLVNGLSIQPGYGLALVLKDQMISGLEFWHAALFKKVHK